MNIVEKYGNDTIQLVQKIETFLKRKLDTHSFGQGVYAENTEFCMTDIPDIGAFIVKFQESPQVVVAGINMVSGDYILQTTEFDHRTLEVYEMKDVNMKRLIARAEYEWSMDAQGIFS